MARPLRSGPRMTFGEAISWCEARSAVWGFYASSDGKTFVLWLEADGERVEIRRRDATEWGCMLLDAIDVHMARSVSEAEPTMRLRRVSIPARANGGFGSAPERRAS